MATAPSIAGCGEDQQANATTPSVVRVRINGEARQIEVDNRTSLLDMLRERAGLTGTKKGCDEGAVRRLHRSGGWPPHRFVPDAGGDEPARAEITTIEGLGTQRTRSTRCRQAFIDA